MELGRSARRRRPAIQKASRQWSEKISSSGSGGKDSHEKANSFRLDRLRGKRCLRKRGWKRKESLANIRD